MLGVADVLSLLATTAKTGCLQVHDDHGQGSVWVRDGSVTAAATDRVPDGPVEEALCDLLRCESGAFLFELDDRAPDSSEFGRLDDLLDRAGLLLAEWDDLQVVVPSLEHQIALVDQLTEAKVSVTAGQWHAIAAIGSGCRVGELAARLGLSELGALRVVHDLKVLGLASIEEPVATGQHAPVPTRLA